MKTTRRHDGDEQGGPAGDPPAIDPPATAQRSTWNTRQQDESLLFPNSGRPDEQPHTGGPRGRGSTQHQSDPLQRPMVVSRKPPPPPVAGAAYSRSTGVLPRPTLPPLEERRYQGSWFASQPEMRWFGGDDPNAPEAGYHDVPGPATGYGAAYDAHDTSGHHRPQEAPPGYPQDSHAPGWSFDRIESDSWFANQPEVQRLVADPDTFQQQVPQAEPPPEPPRPRPRPASPEQRSRPLHLRQGAGQPPVPQGPPVQQSRPPAPQTGAPASAAAPTGRRRQPLSHEQIAEMMAQRQQADQQRAHPANRAPAPTPRPRAAIPPPPPPAPPSLQPAAHGGEDPTLPLERGAYAAAPGSWFAQQPEFQRAQRRYEVDGRWSLPWRPILLVTLLVAIVGMASLMFPGLFGGRSWIATDATFDIEPSTPRPIGQGTQSAGQAAEPTAQTPSTGTTPQVATPGTTQPRRGVTVLQRRANGGPIDPNRSPGGGAATGVSSAPAPAQNEVPPPAFPPLISPGGEQVPGTQAPTTQLAPGTTPQAGQNGADGQSSVFSPSRPPTSTTPQGAEGAVDPFSQFSAEGANLAPAAVPQPGVAPAGIEVVPAAFVAEDASGSLGNARTLFLQRNYPEAGRMLRDMIASDDSNEAALDLYSQVLMMERNHTAALEILDTLAARRPNDARVLLDRGTALLALGRSPEAVAVADSALSAAPNALPPMLLRAKAAAGAGDMADAMNGCERISEIGGSRSVSEWCRGTAQNQAGNHFVAVRMYITTLSSAEPDFVQEKQVLLRDLVLYDGPVDGKSSQKLIDAVTACAVARNCIL